mmetsp:Transcript_39894/g.89386  ORF Transcript_39894/g.89386 Transcript_39894/m.89386 type:complete len:745 (+) Transcript_39894:225-2459(+)
MALCALFSVGEAKCRIVLRGPLKTRGSRAPKRPKPGGLPFFLLFVSLHNAPQAHCDPCHQVFGHLSCLIGDFTQHFAHFAEVSESRKGPGVLDAIYLLLEPFDVLAQRPEVFLEGLQSLCDGELGRILGRELRARVNRLGARGSIINRPVHLDVEACLGRQPLEVLARQALVHVALEAGEVGRVLLRQVVQELHVAPQVLVAAHERVEGGLGQPQVAVLGALQPRHEARVGQDVAPRVGPRRQRAKGVDDEARDDLEEQEHPDEPDEIEEHPELIGGLAADPAVRGRGEAEHLGPEGRVLVRDEPEARDGRVAVGPPFGVLEVGEAELRVEHAAAHHEVEHSAELSTGDEDGLHDVAQHGAQVQHVEEEEREPKVAREDAEENDAQKQGAVQEPIFAEEHVIGDDEGPGLISVWHTNICPQALDEPRSTEAKEQRHVQLCVLPLLEIRVRRVGRVIVHRVHCDEDENGADAHGPGHEDARPSVSGSLHGRVAHGLLGSGICLGDKHWHLAQPRVQHDYPPPKEHDKHQKQAEHRRAHLAALVAVAPQLRSDRLVPVPVALDRSVSVGSHEKVQVEKHPRRVHTPLDRVKVGVHERVRLGRIAEVTDEGHLLHKPRGGLDEGLHPLPRRPKIHRLQKLRLGDGREVLGLFGRGEAQQLDPALPRHLHLGHRLVHQVALPPPFGPTLRRQELERAVKGRLEAHLVVHGRQVDDDLPALAHDPLPLAQLARVAQSAPALKGLLGRRL